jgi:LysM domain
MNYVNDTKNLVNNNYIDSRKYLFTDRGSATINADRAAFARTLQQIRQANGVNTSSSLQANLGSKTQNDSSALPSTQTTLLNPNVPSVSVKSGDTLSNIVRNYVEAQGQPVSNTEALKLAQVVAKSNGIENPDKIFPGQVLKLDALSEEGQDWAGLNTNLKRSVNNPSTPYATGPSTSNVLSSRLATLSSLGSGAQPRLQRESLNPTGESISTGATTLASWGDNPILTKTISRAVEKGFIPPQEQQAVYEKIIKMSQTYQFNPDDFARLTLMESDGMNPKASNNKCHGIIQFCEGPDRGAASAGFAANPKDITNHSVLQQLDLVSKYFDETGLKNFGPARLDDLYLTVLTPAARSETRQHANLNISGAQASLLHVNKDTTAPITRSSIIKGLHQNALNRLGLDFNTADAVLGSGFAGVNNMSNLNHTLNVGHSSNGNRLNHTIAAGGASATSAVSATVSATVNATVNATANATPNAAVQLAQNMNLNNANTTSASNSANKAQALRVSAYLNQTYLP